MRHDTPSHPFEDYKVEIDAIRRAYDMAGLRLTPYTHPSVGLVEALLMRTRPEYVAAVLVAGEVLYHEGRFGRIAADMALASLKRAMAAVDRPGSERTTRRGIG
jgi:hypothetical protein